MVRQWLTLVIIVLVYIPVAIDATVLHVASPTLSAELAASGNELLWIIDIYSLVMAGMVLPMGALGDRIGFKRLLLTGSGLFGLASFLAAMSASAEQLIASRAILAIGAAMIVPATLAGIRNTFSKTEHRNMALGVWAAVGSGGAAFGPLIGGWLLAHFNWAPCFWSMCRS
jgi:DHA2 family multidrug resistance protein-like MFS transporter